LPIVLMLWLLTWLFTYQAPPIPGGIGTGF